MFSGIVREVGVIASIDSTEAVFVFGVRSSGIISELAISESVMVNGVCSTVTKLNDSIFYFEIMPETLSKTSFADLKAGDSVNLEPSLKMGQELSGHLVSGHVDLVASIVSVEERGDSKRFGFELPDVIRAFVAYKGSVCLDGVSLTVSELDDEKSLFYVDLIPHTLSHTTFHAKQKNDTVNIEVDMIARYLARLTQ